MARILFFVVENCMCFWANDLNFNQAMSTKNKTLGKANPAGGGEKGPTGGMDR